MSDAKYQVGTVVRLLNQGPKTYIIAVVEHHNSTAFYRLKELPSALFVASSLEVAEP